MDKDRRISWAFATVAAGLVVVAAAECAGAARQLTARTLFAVWGLADAALLAAVARMHKRGEIIAGLKGGWRRLRTRVATRPAPPFWNPVLLVLAAGMVLLAGVIALQCPTNVWDSLTYHVPRVMHWMQQRSLSPYPTNILRQLESAPGAELQTATLALLSGDDWALNLPQWWALLACGLLASLMAERFLKWHFGNKPLDEKRVRWCGLLAALIAVTVPQGVTQAISTQNDLLSAQWVMLLAVFGLLLTQEPKNYLYAAGAGGALALGIANKPTMFIYAAPFVPVIALWVLRKSARTMAALGVVTAVLALGVNLPWMTRNYEVFHHPLGSQDTRRIQPLQNHAPAKMGANVLRNMALYASTPFDWSTSVLNHVLGAGFNFVGEPPQDEGSVWHDQTFYFPPRSQVRNGDGFGGIVAALPLLLGALFFLIKFKWNSPLLVYFGLLAAGFALFCGYLRWQPWHQRLHLPFFILAAPFAGMVLGWVWNRWLALTGALLLVLNAVLVLYYNPTYPIFRLSDEPFKTREERYFCWRPDLYPGTAELAGDIVHSGVTNVLLKIGVDTWEYPLWVCLKNQGFQGTIQHAFVDNESGRLGAPDLDLPGTVILTEDATMPPQPDFGLTVGYDSWNAHFRGKAENRIKLVSNRALLTVAVQQTGHVEIRCNVIDQNGQPVTNNIIRLQTPGFARDYPLTVAPLVMECPLKPGPNMMGLFLVNPPAAEQRVLTLANLTTKFAAP